MTVEELEKLLSEAAEIASERREKAAESQMTADLAKAQWGHSHASGWQMAAEYALRTADVLDQTAALARRIIAAERMAEALRALDDDGDCHDALEWLENRLKLSRAALAAYEATK